jgi:hypothetical protein
VTADKVGGFRRYRILVWPAFCVKFVCFDVAGCLLTSLRAAGHGQGADRAQKVGRGTDNLHLKQYTASGGHIKADLNIPYRSHAATLPWP